MTRAILEARLRELDTALARLDADDASLRHDRADATADDEHDPEGSTLSGEWQRVDALRRARLDERAEVLAALDRVEAGTYGICAVCGRPIPAARLEVRPMATTCVACAAAV
ncbi:TraR/DksA C4-type zinc finger protein [Microbacterium sp. T2.11-28]|uniref:TraR/DksA family transcriptional regulator n=1 Tax=Microbacterium sp. T2.11-28 TaxID=3041169 RepID=UPI0024777F37|nr:TraR/DksA C4-type zinc finger protein [Microbacterium sp. T2.11-28]CAI9389699.1 RNA polymerase-binding transcription factor DksA [Microbacterium sp. T2.11-28]